MTSVLQNNRQIVIFDGVCNFCNGAVNFIIKRDESGVFTFVPMQSDIAKELMEKFHVDAVGMETFILIKKDHVFIKSDAALEICTGLSGLWPYLTKAKIIPSFIRDFLYTVFARNRYFLFGKKDQCMIPSEEVKARFLHF